MHSNSFTGADWTGINSLSSVFANLNSLFEMFISNNNKICIQLYIGLILSDADRLFVWLFVFVSFLVKSNSYFSGEDTFGSKRNYMQLIDMKIQQLSPFLTESTSILQKKLNNEKLINLFPVTVSTKIKIHITTI